jgi:hypothetical protein
MQKTKENTKKKEKTRTKHENTKNACKTRLIVTREFDGKSKHLADFI